jgi:hypothetical protein
MTLQSTSNNMNLNDNMKCLTERENIQKRGEAANKTNPALLYINQQKSSYVGTAKNSSSNLPIMNSRL